LGQKFRLYFQVRKLNDLKNETEFLEKRVRTFRNIERDTTEVLCYALTIFRLRSSKFGQIRRQMTALSMRIFCNRDL